MAIKQTQKGFALLIAVIFMSVMLSLGLVLGSLAYKQQVLASNAVESQYAFYAADAGMECALYYDQHLNTFAFPASQPASAPLMTCGGVSSTFPASYPTGIVSYTAGASWVLAERLSLDAGGCADVTLYKPLAGSAGVTYIFSQGYNVSCANISAARTASRGLEVHY